MPKVFVTPELANLIKEIRILNKIKSKDLANHIKKSTASITKLEKGEIKSLESSVLTQILQFITNGNENFDDMINAVYKNLSFQYTSEEIERQLWFMNYDTVARKIPIPVELISDINERLNKANISLHYLVERINSNEGISDELAQSNKYDYNMWYDSYFIDKTNHQFIKMKITEKTLEDIMSRKRETINYITMLSVCYYLEKIEKFGDIKKIDENSDIEIMRNTHNYLNQHKFYSLLEKNKLISKAKSEEDLASILNDFDKINAEEISKILKHFNALSDFNIKSTNEQLRQFEKNLEWDSSFMLKLLGSKFDELGEVSFNIKKNLLNEIDSLIEKYINTPEQIKNIETY